MPHYLVQILVRIDPKTKKALQEKSDREHTSLNTQINQAIDKHLKTK